ncbi:CDP-glycerol glycerophosphotransferase family protein [Staphylococcus borealis]|uniref:CDP-glycerol glycerophosphotransferase family protein n=1 Tax=Staphylococcus borealis TaxID=2742203 RepID=UPI0025A19FC0|nr:CDP-glycerol glycerophosphotransferase family protein [Staphylococcus borealis]MDM7864521.1 CDP-glycerol glycerophosphotransferase family protein [Staphylococcus borealis]
MIHKISTMLRRKFQLYKISVNKQHVEMKFELTNFVHFNKNYFCIKNESREVPFDYLKLSKNTFSIKINLENLSTDKVTFDFYYKKKLLWLVADENINSVLELYKKIYIVKVDKSLTLTKYKTNFNLANKNKEVHISQINDECISLNTDRTIESVILLNCNQQLEIPTQNNQVNLALISQIIKKQKYTVYIVSNNIIYHPQFLQSQKINYLFLDYKWSDNNLNVSMNTLEVSQFSANSLLNETSIRIGMFIENLDPNYTLESLGLVDVDLTQLNYLNTNVYNSKVFSKIVVSNFKNMKNKKLIAIYQHQQKNIKKVYVLNNRKKIPFTDYYNSEEQIYQINIKNKNGLTIVNSKPKIKLGVNSLDEDHLNIYLQPNKIYETFQYFITFEERSSLNRYEMEIHRGEQNIKIPYNEIEYLRTSSKNIIDIFISIYDGTTLIRKEKIKYRKGIYKKDNYITLKKQNLDNKQVFYMLTLTPFKNIKIESFELTNEQYKILENGKKQNNVWLIGERTDTAQDNGIQLFKWLQKNTDIEAYYVINDDSNDYERIKHLNNIITFGSKKHFEVAAKANVLISTHDLENILPYKTARNFWNYEDSIKVFLQHGVLGRKKVEYNKDYYDLPFHLFNVSSTHEKYDIVVNQLGYSTKDVAITGLSRFDNLPLKPKNKVKKILIMPTWRDWLNSEYAFNNSEYMRRYLELIRNSKLEKLIENHDVEINFYPHYRSQSFFKYHIDKTEGKINYITLGEKTVQDLLIEHDILITDYSSVSFDFSYMKKPVIFYHFDVDRFFRKGILRPVAETFIGDIAYNETELLNKLEKTIYEGTSISDTDLSNIFDYIDHKNNKRVYNSILNKINEY